MAFRSLIFIILLLGPMLSIAHAGPAPGGAHSKDQAEQRSMEIKRLAIAYIMEENGDLKDALLIVSKLTKIQFKVCTRSLITNIRCN
jgi:hypothetical protein